MAVLMGLGCTLRSLPLETPCLQLGTKGLDLWGWEEARSLRASKGQWSWRDEVALVWKRGQGGTFQMLPGWPGQGPRRVLAQRRRFNRVGSRTPQSEIFTYYIGRRKLLGALVSHQ